MSKPRTEDEVRKEAYTDVEGFLQLVITTEALSRGEKEAYNRVLRYVRGLAGIPHRDY